MWGFECWLSAYMHDLISYAASMTGWAIDDEHCSNPSWYLHLRPNAIEMCVMNAILLSVLQVCRKQWCMALDKHGKTEDH